MSRFFSRKKNKSANSRASPVVDDASVTSVSDLADPLLGVEPASTSSSTSSRRRRSSKAKSSSSSISSSSTTTKDDSSSLVSFEDDGARRKHGRVDDRTKRKRSKSKRKSSKSRRSSKEDKSDSPSSTAVRVAEDSHVIYEDVDGSDDDDDPIAGDDVGTSPLGGGGGGGGGGEALSSDEGSPPSVDSGGYVKDPTQVALLRDGLVKFRNASSGSPRMKLARFMFLPLCYVALLWCLLLAPEHVGSMLSFSSAFSCRHADELTLEERLPPRPTGMYQAWRLGQLAARLSDSVELMDVAEPMAVVDHPALLEATVLLGRRTDVARVTAEQLLGMGDALKELDEAQGVLSMVLGLLTFVNFMSMIGVLGVTATIGPVVYILMKPCIPTIAAALWAIFERAIVPIVVAMLPLGEAAGYFALFGLVAKGAQCASPHQDGYAFLLAFMGVFFTLPLAWFSLWLHNISPEQLGFLRLSHRASAMVNHQRTGEATALLVSIFFMLVTAPVAILYESSILGVVCVFCVYSSMGFGAGSTGVCFFVGFKNEDVMERCTYTSLVLLACFLPLRWCPSHVVVVRCAQPFAMGVVVFGSMSYFLGLMVVCNYCYLRGKYGHAWKRYYTRRNVCMFLSLVAALFVGHTLHMHALVNTTYVFFVLWVMEKMAEERIYPKNVWIAVFCASVALIVVGLVLNRYPSIILGMFDAKTMLAAATPPTTKEVVV